MDPEKYKSLFVGETREYLQLISQQILQMKETSEPSDLDSLLRAAHSIKGMSAAMGYAGIKDVSHLMEDLIGKIKLGEIQVDARFLAVLLQGVDLIGQMVDEIERSGVSAIRSDSFQNMISALGSSEFQKDLPVETGNRTQEQEAGRVSTVRVDTVLIDRLMEGLGELMIYQEALQEGDPENPEIRRVRLLTQQLYSYATDLRMLPFETLCHHFPRIVHDLGGRFGKDIRLQMEGTEIRMDKALLDEMADPLIHLIRNAIDHGIEAPEDRVRAGKNRAGQLHISVAKQGDRFLIRVEDDGRGLDPQRIRKTAVERGLIQERIVPFMNLREVLMLITRPGFSTAPEISDISGRGVGMDIVRSRIDALGGTLKIESEPGKFTRFDILIPFTIAVIPALLIRLEQFLCAVPFSRIDRFLLISRKDVRSVHGRPVFFSQNAILYIEKLWSLLRRIPGDYDLPETFSVFVTEHHNRRMAWVVDELIAEKEILLKPFQEPLSLLGCYSGASVLGKGQVVPLLDLEHLYRELFV